jgi:hypothetical protein
MRKAKRARPARRPTTKRRASDPAQFRLLGPEAMGGHRARQGFRFQDPRHVVTLVLCRTQSIVDTSIGSKL